MHRLVAVVLAMSVSAVACNGNNSTQIPTSLQVTTTVSASPTSTTLQQVGACDAATAATIGSFDAIFNRIEADEAAITDHVQAVVELKREFDGLVGTECDPAETGDALAVLGEWMRDQATARNVSVRTLIAGFLEDIEEIPSD